MTFMKRARRSRAIVYVSGVTTIQNVTLQTHPATIRAPSTVDQNVCRAQLAQQVTSLGLYLRAIARYSNACPLLRTSNQNMNLIISLNVSLTSV